MDKALNFLGLCRRAGKLLIGEDGVSGAARSGQAVLLMNSTSMVALEALIFAEAVAIAGIAFMVGRRISS